jgi:hypothetical protein
MWLWSVISFPFADGNKSSFVDFRFWVFMPSDDWRNESSGSLWDWILILVDTDWLRRVIFEVELVDWLEKVFEESIYWSPNDVSISKLRFCESKTAVVCKGWISLWELFCKLFEGFWDWGLIDGYIFN